MIKHPLFDPGPSVVVKWQRTPDNKPVRRVHENHVVPEPLRGMDSAKAKLTDDDVREIRRLYEIKELKHNPSAWNAKCRLKKEMHRKYTLTNLAEKYGVGRECIRRIVHRYSWAHID